MILNQWDSQLSTEDTNELVTRLALRHLGKACQEDHRTQSTRAYIANRDYFALVNMDLTYDGLEPQCAYHIRQALAFFQKREDLDLGIDKRAVARRKFVESEELCRQTNHIFRLVHSGGFCFPPDVNSVLHAAQRKIATILGDVPSLSEIKFRFGPGATTQVLKRHASTRNKLSQRHACSVDFIPLLDEVLDEVQGWIFDPIEDTDSASIDVDIHPGRLNFVPKNAKTDRPIVVEPALNSFVQLGVGDYMAARLKRFGVDISDQSKNKRLAREGSLTGALATLDLSSASDTVARLLVQDLLPYEWYNLLTQISTSEVEYEGVTARLEKISSMGNGITFPLETLIFYAVASACTSSSNQEFVNAYGDDIIVPTESYDLLCKVLHCIGFIPNSEKSYSSGNFRESCGGDYLSGIDIRPIYIKNRVAGFDAFRLHNFYVRSGQPDFAAMVLEHIGPQLRLYGPDGYGDGHLVGDYVPNRKKKHVQRGYGGHTFDTFSWVSRKSFRVHSGDRVLPAYSVYLSPAKQGVADLDEDFFVRRFPRSRPGYYKVSEPVTCYREGKKSFGVTVPGVQGYKRISIYILNPTAL